MYSIRDARFTRHDKYLFSTVRGTTNHVWQWHNFIWKNRMMYILNHVDENISVTTMDRRYIKLYIYILIHHYYLILNSSILHLSKMLSLCLNASVIMELEVHDPCERNPGLIVKSLSSMHYRVYLELFPHPNQFIQTHYPTILHFDPN